MTVDSNNVTLTKEDVLAAVGLAQADGPWDGWEHSELLADTSPLPRLLAGIAELNRIDPGVGLQQSLTTSARVISETPVLRRLLWHCHWVLFGRRNEQDDPPTYWPMLSEKWGEPGRLFYAMVLLSGMKDLLHRHGALGIPRTITDDTLSDLPRWLRQYHDRHGQWGLAEMGWLASHFAGRLFKLGRLQFRFERFPHDMHVFGRRENVACCVLAGEGMRFRADGQFDGTDGIHDETGAWIATYERMVSGDVRGYPMSRNGAAERQPVCLKEQEWESRLARSDAILGVHIPAIGPMKYDACLASFREAKQFFATYFPQRIFRAFTCESWLLDPQLAKYLPPESNIVQFQSLFQFYPLPGANSKRFYQWVFGSSDIDPLAVTPQTSLQQALVDHVRQGGHWRTAGGVILTDATVLANADG